MTPSPCPHCGSLPEIEQQSRYPVLPDPIWICTHRCQESPKFYLELSDDFTTEPEAVEAWNKLLEGFLKSQLETVKSYLRQAADLAGTADQYDRNIPARLVAKEAILTFANGLTSKDMIPTPIHVPAASHPPNIRPDKAP